MKKYEMIREIFNSCDNSKMRDVKISEVETDDPETFVRELTPGEASSWISKRSARRPLSSMLMRTA